MYSTNSHLSRSVSPFASQTYQSSSTTRGAPVTSTRTTRHVGEVRQHVGPTTQHVSHFVGPVTHQTRQHVITHPGSAPRYVQSSQSSSTGSRTSGIPGATSTTFASQRYATSGGTYSTSSSALPEMRSSGGVFPAYSTVYTEAPRVYSEAPRVYSEAPRVLPSSPNHQLQRVSSRYSHTPSAVSYPSEYTTSSTAVGGNYRIERIGGSTANSTVAPPSYARSISGTSGFAASHTMYGGRSQTPPSRLGTQYNVSNQTSYTRGVSTPNWKDVAPQRQTSIITYESQTPPTPIHLVASQPPFSDHSVRKVSSTTAVRDVSPTVSSYVSAGSRRHVSPLSGTSSIMRDAYYQPQPRATASSTTSWNYVVPTVTPFHAVSHSRTENYPAQSRDYVRVGSSQRFPQEAFDQSWSSSWDGQDKVVMRGGSRDGVRVQEERKSGAFPDMAAARYTRDVRRSNDVSEWNTREVRSTATRKSPRQTTYISSLSFKEHMPKKGSMDINPLNPKPLLNISTFYGAHDQGALDTEDDGSDDNNVFDGNNDVSNHVDSEEEADRNYMKQRVSIDAGRKGSPPSGGKRPLKTGEARKAPPVPPVAIGAAKDSHRDLLAGMLDRASPAPVQLLGSEDENDDADEAFVFCASTARSTARSTTRNEG